jgi:predicted RecB family endonuclease
MISQEIMHNPGRSANDKDLRLMKLIDSSTTSYKQHLAMRLNRLARVTEKVASNIEDHEKLTVAERDADIVAKEARKVADVTNKSKLNAEIEKQRYLKAMVTNTQLKTIASEQASELERLRRQLEIEKRRTYPILTPPATSRPATAAENGMSKHPDFRLPQIFNASNPPSRAVTAMPGPRKPTKRVTASR